MSVFSEIDSCLVSSMLSALPEANGSTQFENAPVFDPKGKPLWFQVFNLCNPAEVITLGEGGQNNITGVFQINIMVPLGSSVLVTNQIVEKVNNFFAIGKGFTYGATTLRIKRCGKAGSSGEAQGYFKTMLSVFWEARFQRYN